MTLSVPNSIASPQSKLVPIWGLWGGASILLLLMFRGSIEEMVLVWSGKEEYSHGFFIPCITFYLIWAKRTELPLVSKLKESVLGLFLVVLGLAVFLLGMLSTVRTLEQYALLITLTGLFAAAFGRHGLGVASVPLLFLIFMVPFPEFILNNLSSKLQLISSSLGVHFIRACNIMVFLEGNVIDLGDFKLQVVDACSGLRYLFPLSSLAFLCAYLFKGPFWQKLLIFLSSAPLTIFMNSFRIGVIGLLVNSWGAKMAEGFLHDFEGWAVFILCMFLLFVEMWVLSRISGKKVAMNELVQIPDAWGAKVKANTSAAVLNKSVYAVLLLLFLGEVANETFRGREDIIPQRKAFLNFPTTLGAWRGRNDILDKQYLDALKLTDYVIVNYVQPGTTTGSVNFYSAYYQAQRKGASVHSPRSCISGDGWQITQFEQREFPDLKMEGQPLRVDRAIIEKGDNRSLVYFWFQQRGRNLTNEFMVKWYLFYDAITENRTDGALVRLVTQIDKTKDIAEADRRLEAFVKDLLPVLPGYLPGKDISLAERHVEPPK